MLVSIAAAVTLHTTVCKSKVVKNGNSQTDILVLRAVLLRCARFYRLFPMPGSSFDQFVARAHSHAGKLLKMATCNLIS